MTKTTLAEIMGLTPDRAAIVFESGRKLLNEHTRQEDLLDGINALPLSPDEKVLLAFTIGISWANAYGRSSPVIMIGPFPG